LDIAVSDPVRDGYAAAVEQFDRARRAGAPMTVRRFDIADRRVVLRVVGPHLADAFTAPWSHLESTDEGGPADLHIDLWHARETGIAPVDTGDGIDAASRFPFRASTDDRILAARQLQTSVWFDRAAAHLVGVVMDVDRRALYETARPVELPILVWLRDQGVPLVHAAFVAHDGRGVLILGRSGSGKSTLAARCVAEGWTFLGDDKLALSSAGDGFVGHSLTSSLHVDGNTLVRVPVLAPYAVAPSLAVDDKSHVPVGRWAPGQLARSAAVSALVIPRFELEGADGVRPAGRRDALLALSLSTLLSLPIAARRSLDSLGSLAERVPAFVVSLKPDDGVVQRVASVLG
jgi:hypothetical protein